MRSLAPHERFRESYFRRNRLPLRFLDRPAPPPAPEPTPRKPPRPNKLWGCPICGFYRESRERGWWAEEGRTFYHYACVPDETVEAHVAQFGVTALARKVWYAKEHG